MKKYLYYSTLLAVFTEAAVTRVVIDVKLFYFIAIFNLIILTIAGRLYINKWLGLFYVFLIFSGVFSILSGTNTIRLFLSQFFGITIVSLFYFNFYTLFKDKLTTVFKDYTMISFYLAVTGILIFLFNLLKGNLVPLKSLMLEPAHYSTIVLPAYLYSLKNKELPRYVWKVILLSIVLSGSSLGLLGLGFSILLIPKRIHFLKIGISLGIAVLIFISAYLTYEPLKLRVDDSVKAIKHRDLTGVNLSTFFLASNFFVAIERIEQNPFLGSGLGSHEKSHSTHVYNLRGIDEFRPYLEINASDAASMFIRVMSEFGLVGIVLVLFFIIKNYVRYDPYGPPYYHWMSNAIGLYFFCKLLREGHHFPPELYFFVFAYVFASLENKALKKMNRESLDAQTYNENG